MELMLRKSFFFPSAEIYGSGFGGFWDFGPYGTAIKRKIVELWRKELVEKENFLEVDGSLVLPKAVFDASGHSANFNDPLTQCGKCNSHYRADSLLSDHVNVNFPEGTPAEKFDKLIKENKLRCPKCRGELGKVKRFNMMMFLEIGATGKQLGGLRPETAQNLFLDFSRMFKSMRQNLPLGLAQSGKAFRNEIAPRNTLLRAREFGQMEIEIFFNPEKINECENFGKMENEKIRILSLNEKKEKVLRAKDLVDKKIVSGKLVAYYIARLQELYLAYGIPFAKMRFREVGVDERAFYSKETWDFEVETGYGWIELVACNYRGDYDLRMHGKGSKKDLKVKEDGKEFVPHIFELSAGLDRAFFVVLNLSLREETKKGEKRILLDIPSALAPFTCGVFPLVKKDGLLEKGLEVFELLKENGLDAVFDEKGSIGRRYARVDELGCPYAVTLDYDSLGKEDVTIRERNSTEQKRVKIRELPELLWRLGNGKIVFKDI